MQLFANLYIFKHPINYMNLITFKYKLELLFIILYLKFIYIYEIKIYEVQVFKMLSIRVLN